MRWALDQEGRQIYSWTSTRSANEGNQWIGIRNNIELLTTSLLSTCVLDSSASMSSEAYAQSNSSRMIWRAVSIHAGSQLCFFEIFNFVTRVKN